VEQLPLKGKIAVVTGGSNGIGAATVRLFAAEGATVYVGYNKGLERARKLIGELPGSGHQPIRIVLEDTASRWDLPAIGNAASTEDNQNLRDYLASYVFLVKEAPGPDHWLPALPEKVLSVVRRMGLVPSVTKPPH